MKKNKSNIYILMALIIILAFLAENKLNFTERLKYPLRYETIVYENAELYNVDPYLIYAVMKAESGFFPYAKSRKNAKGLMQIAPITWEWACKETGANISSIYSPFYNIKVGAWYLSALLKEFENENLAIVAYNAGSGNVQNWISQGRLDGEDFTKWDIPFPETKSYIYKVNEFKSSYIKLYEELD